MEKSIKKQKIICIVVFYIIFGALMIWGTFSDLEINKALFNYENGFGIFMEKWGMLPQFIIQLLAYSMLIAAYHPIDEAFSIAESIFPFFKYLRENKFTYFVFFLLLHIMYAAFAYGAFMGSDQFLNFFMGGLFGNNLQDLLINAGWSRVPAIIAWAVLRIALVLISILFFRSLDKKYIKALEFMAVAGLLMYHSTEIIGILKAHFHRIRFREMIAYSHGLVNENGWTERGSNNIPREWISSTDFSAFDRWYKVGNDMGVYSEAHSFPSGHTTAAAFAMLLAPLFSKCKALNKFFIPAFAIGMIYTLGMGISRLIRGAHYLTDISSAALIMFTLLLIIIGILNLFEEKSKSSLINSNHSVE